MATTAEYQHKLWLPYAGMAIVIVTDTIIECSHSVKTYRHLII